MDSAAHSKGRKPVATVTVGSVTIPIYSSPVTASRSLEKMEPANQARPQPESTRHIKFLIMKETTRFCSGVTRWKK